MTSIARGLLAGLLASAVLAAGCAAPALGQEATQLGTFKKWTAWKGADTNGEMCYISATPESWEPKSVEGQPVNRSAINFLVIHRKGLGTKNEVQTLVGYPFNTTASNASATIDGKVWPMVTEGEAAWLAETEKEADFVAALKAGSTLVFKGTSQKGRTMSDTYPLSGVTAAMTEIDKACT